MKRYELPGLDTEKGLEFLWNYLLAHGIQRSHLTLEQHSVRFLAYCLERFPRSKAQMFQDLYVTYKLGEKSDGYFVEFGAMDGILFSNTYYLEKGLGWQGILAEPFLKWRTELRSNRSVEIDYRCVWRESGKSLEFLAANHHPELSSLAAFATGDDHAAARLADADTIMVPTVSLNDLLADHDAPGTIDYLSVDTEGSELEILRAFDFGKFQVRVITVEHNYRSEVRESLRRLLEPHGFVREFQLFSQADDWYFHPARV